MNIGGVSIEFLGHSGFLIVSEGGKRIAIDPYNISNAVKSVDLILITHSHYDHCSVKDIKLISRKGTVIVLPADAQSKVMRVEDIKMEVIEVGDEFKIGNSKIEAFLAYNINKDYHPKKEGWFGYLIKMKNVIIYHAGDTDKIPEMKNLTGYGNRERKFVALLPVSGKYVMDFEEAVEAASLISPNLAIPCHYGAGVAGTIDDANRFVDECKELGLNAVVLDKI